MRGVETADVESLNRRGFMGAILALAAAPAIVRADSLMRIVPRATGVLTLAIALEHRGWTRRGGPALLSPEAAGARPRRDHRYILLTGDYRYTPDIADAIRAINAGEATAEGEVLAILITRVASEGVNFKGIREVHVLEPWYNAAKIEQVVGRAVRTCQHAHLAPEKRNVTVYYYPATLGGGRESSDLHMYAMSADKAARIATVEEQLRSHAIDCTLFADTAKTVDPGLRLRMVDARGRSREWRPAATVPAGSCAAGARPPSDPKGTAVQPAFFDHLVARAERSAERFLATAPGGTATLAELMAAVEPMPKEVYFDALGRLIDGGRARFDDGRYSAVQDPVAVAPERHEVVEDAPPSASPLSPLSPIDPRTAYADAVARLSMQKQSGAGVIEYEALNPSQAALAGAALRFLVPTEHPAALTPLERHLRAGLEAAGLLDVRAGTWVDHHSPSPTVYGRVRKGKGLEPVASQTGAFESLRTEAAARIAAWRSAGETYGMLSVYRPRKGGAGGVVLKIVRPVGTEESHSGFVCVQTSQFRISDLRAAIRTESGQDAPESTTSKPELCDRLGVALLVRKRLLTPLESALLHK